LHAISPGEMTKMGLATWTLPRLEDATIILASTVELSLLAGHIRDFKLLPEPDDYGKELLQEYVQGLAGRISNILQVLGNSVEKLAATLSKIASAEYVNRPNLIAAAQTLQELGNYIVPPSYVQDEVEMDHKQLIEWADQLEKARDYAFLFYLLWASDILDETAT